jgi:AraC-like DNA-binding protein
MLSFDLPETAICTFERIHGLRVTVHDLWGTLWPFLSPDRFQHTQGECQAVKALDGGEACRAFDISRLRRDLADLPQGRVHVCHAGLVEWAAPVFGDDRLRQVIFAGVRSPGEGLTGARSSPRPSRRRPLPMVAAADAVPSPTPVNADEADLILEHLCQLAARLQLWSEAAALEVAGGGTLRAGPSGEDGGGDLLAARRTAVARFIHGRHTEQVSLGDLARLLGLSESRTSHVVRALYGRSFQDLLTEARLQTASGLLRHSRLPVLEVGLRSGFDDPSHFHRAFRRKTGTTPGRYRAAATP